MSEFLTVKLMLAFLVACFISIVGGLVLIWRFHRYACSLREELRGVAVDAATITEKSVERVTWAITGNGAQVERVLQRLENTSMLASRAVEQSVHRLNRIEARIENSIEQQANQATQIEKLALQLRMTQHHLAKATRQRDRLRTQLRK